jgi:hypothetical protein
MPRLPGQEPPPGEGGGAAHRLRQFEQARGLDPDDATAEEGPGSEEEAEEPSEQEPPDCGEGEDA